MTLWVSGGGGIGEGSEGSAIGGNSVAFRRSGFATSTTRSLSVGIVKVPHHFLQHGRCIVLYDLRAARLERCGDLGQFEPFAEGRAGLCRDQLNPVVIEFRRCDGFRFVQKADQKALNAVKKPVFASHRPVSYSNRAGV